ncbi:TIGR03745 family integrating conjugative element membrane protein [Escherichia sp. E4385]|uniref:TIGR03745 family integrating conjugative element membrane protein n=1 Tax=Escherichia sp. E4385 TaxID=2040639 RepID=UPI00107F1413|nr:TIGR03745 family integrating conjugative element membrane protein [Escherichia sp. E4385]TGC14778.1 TIGR03745 family integrating conjugative element membrane protein [Escherichia sp. E4385]TLI97496.1 TIGR03745 family integrating conjugative element membrane protein [Escherichia sp. E4385]
MYCFALSSLRFSFRLWCARVLTVSLTGISVARAALPPVEGPKTSTDSSFYGQIMGYINDGVVLAGLVLAACSMLAVGNAIISTFSEVRDGKATWGKFGMLVVVGVILIVMVIWLASKAATILL